MLKLTFPQTETLKATRKLWQPENTVESTSRTSERKIIDVAWNKLIMNKLFSRRGSGVLVSNTTS